MKKLISMVLTVLLIVGMLPLTAIPASAATEGYYYYTVTDGEAEITDCKSTISGDIIIPSTLGGYPVTSIGGFAYCNNLNSVVIPDGVINIDDNAFEDCSGLTSVKIGNSVSVTSIGNYAFSKCSSLVSLTIPASVTSLGYGAFENCSGLESIIVDKNNTVYHSNNNCLIQTKSKTLVLGCKNSTIPSDGSVISIGQNSFNGCSGLTSVSIPEGVTKIDYSAFDYCNNLKSIYIPSSVNNIVDTIFYYCDSLETIQVSENNKSYVSKGNCLIEISSKKLLEGCKTSIIPDDGSVEFIYGGAFWARKGLTSISIPPSVTKIGSRAFMSCDDLASVTMSNGLVRIGGEAFSDCDKLTTISIPESVSYIEDDAFEGCSSLEYITVDKNNLVYHSNSNCLIETKSRTLVLGCKTSTIPSDGSVTSIEQYAFLGTDITSIVIPNSVTSIGDYAFEGCNNLKTVYNLSELDIVKGSTDNGYVAYYADKVITDNGDNDGDGEFTSNDLLSLQQHIMGLSSLVVPPDLNNDGVTDSADIVLLQLKILGY